MESLKIVIVENDALCGELISRHLSLNPGYEVHWFKTAEECLDGLFLRPHIISMDSGLPDMDGSELLLRILKHNANIPVIVTSIHENISLAVNFLKAGARDYIVKDNNMRGMLSNAILKIREDLELKKEAEDLRGLVSDSEKTLRQHTADIITFYLKRHNYDVLEVARRLDIGKSTIYNMIQKKEIVKHQLSS